MARTDLFRLIERALRAAHAAEGRPSARHDLAARYRGARIDRREFIRRTSVLSLGALTLGASSGCDDDDGPSGDGPSALPDPARDVRVAIIGGGIAGLHCAYRLRQHGVGSRIIEATSRVGGRMFTARGRFAFDQVAELGGEFIDSNHTFMQSLAAELDVPLDDVRNAYGPNVIQDSYLFFGQRWTEAQIVEAFRPLAAKMADEVARTDADPDLFAATDVLSIEAWLDRQVEAGQIIRSLLLSAYRGEYGLEPDEQSVFNLLYLIDYEQPEPFRIFGDSDERFHTRGGNDTITSRLGAAVEDSLELDSRLLRVRSRADGTYEITVQRGSGVTESVVDHVVFALPFTLLREVELDVDLPADKREIISTLGYGTNAKLMGGVVRRVWVEDHASSGSCFTDTVLQSTWDTSRAQEGTTGIITNFVGGERGIAIGSATAEERMQEILPALDEVFPGTAAAYIPGSAIRMHWPSAPFHRGSYACYRPGQWSFSGIEGERAGNLHFCGEHCSVDFQGFMEGGCETGARAAGEILADLSIPLQDPLASLVAEPARTARGRRTLRRLSRRR